MNVQLEPKVGQVWRSKNSGRLVRVRDACILGNRRLDWVEWVAITGRAGSGIPLLTTFTRHHQFVAESEAEL